MMVKMQDDRTIKTGMDCPSDHDSTWCYADADNDVYGSFVDSYEDDCGVLVIFDLVTGDRNMNILRCQARGRAQRVVRPLLVAHHHSLVPPQ